MASAHAESVRRIGFLASLLLLSSAMSAFADADLRITKTGPVSVKPGEPIAYVIEVANIGPDDAADTMLFDPNPPGLVFLPPITGDCTGTFPCSLGTVPAGQTRTVTATFQVPTNYAGPDLIQNTASATTSSPESVFDNNLSTAATALLRIAGFHSLPPCRIVDTRNAAGPLGGPSLAAGLTRTFNVRSTCGLPDNASSVSVNLTVTGPTGAGNLRLFAGGTTPPLASVINYATGQTRANNGIVPLSTTGTLGVKSDQATGATHIILDVNGYFSVTDQVPTPVGFGVKVRPAPEVELTFDHVTVAGVTTASVIEFLDNRTQDEDQDLRDFFPVGSPYRTLLPSVIIPSYVKALGKGGPGGVPTFVLSIVDTTAVFSRTAEFHGLEEFRLGWHPPCVVTADRTQEPRTFYARELPKNEPGLVEENDFAGSPVFVDISSGCGSNKGSGWNFSLYLTGRDTRTPLQIADFMLLRIQDAISALAAFIDSGVASQLQAQASAAYATLVSAPSSSLASINNFLGIVDDPANAGLFDNTTRNVRGEMAARAQAGGYMIRPPGLPNPIVEFVVPTANSWPQGIALGPDGNLWFTEAQGNKIGRITPTGVITEFPIPTAGSGPFGIALGPDGNLWFTEDQGNKIGRITPTGVITEFPLPIGGSAPRGIALGPDGNLWFTEYQGNRIGRITPAGAITAEFAVPTAGSRPQGIALGPDGNLWFTEYQGNKIGRITPVGAITEFVVPTVGGPFEIASGPDGNLWFTEYTGNRIGRITPTGVITEFVVPTVGNVNIAYIASGADGNLWFAEYFSNKIGRITPTGVITEFTVPTAGGGPWGIAAGPDGKLWFTERGGNKIGRINP